MNNHDDLNEEYFKKVWAETCSKYNTNPPEYRLPKTRRIIVIGDIHGDWNMCLQVLKLARLIDNNNNWIGGDTKVVQLGDQIDRCRSFDIPCYLKTATIPDEGNDFKILNFFTDLHAQAIQVGGGVYSLLGNHELMNVNGNFDYVSHDGYTEFAELGKNKNKLIPDNMYEQSGKNIRKWMFSPGNTLATFLGCTRYVHIIIGNNLFVHGGILPELAKKYNYGSINRLMSLFLFNKLKEPNKYRDVIGTLPESPLWTRAYNPHSLSETKCDELLNPVFDLYKVGKIYVGHTPVMEGIKSICNKRIWMNDYGMSSAFDKYDKKNTRSIAREAQVLEILNDNEFNILK
jgi:hypothetical protein